MASGTRRAGRHVRFSHETKQANRALSVQRPKYLRFIPHAACPKWSFCILLLCLMATPVAAQPDHTHDWREPIAAFVLAVILAGHHIIAFTETLIGPSMGISSVLWLVMRNDVAIEPKWSWMVLGLWSLLMLLYFTMQCRRVANHSLYILLTIATASLSMCMVALVQQSSLQSGLVTAIPPCTSFAAYAVAYFFPDRHRGNSWLFDA
ncbi:hypothetical protein C7974DRAFT_99812 [Boeremia exigua]|uniref:uncharacterized protein n=1 Tax=Boeremia exigua TaxID=749465 RepID=UPI001E8E39C5|nr:uncharacterized protein C7974DRAFT_99812 [Boeremia exigua]KAH6642348.1 hypothetical protein C7974DRAFT_99812 [Boeremia exigua]